MRTIISNQQKTRFDIGIHWTNRFYTASGEFIDPISQYPGADSAGWQRVFYPSLDEMSKTNSLNMEVVKRFLDNLALFKKNGFKVLHTFNAYRKNDQETIHALTGFNYDSSEYAKWVQDRLAELIPWIPAGQLDAIECANEPPNLNENSAIGLARLSQVFYRQFKTLYSSDITVCSPAFQGGQWNNFYLWLTAELVDSNGIKTLGEKYMDVIAWHPYGTLDTMQMVTAGNHQLASDIAMTAMAGIRRAMEPRLKINSASVWYGKPMPPIWATEFNVSGTTQTSTDSGFRFQRLNSNQKLAAIRYLVLCAFAAGFDKAFLYAVDHGWYYSNCPITVLGSSNGRFQIRIDAQDRAAFTGDAMFIQGSRLAALNNKWTVINPSIDGKIVELDGAPYVPGDWTGAQANWRRYQLGSWNTAFGQVVAEVTSSPLTAGLIVGVDSGTGTQTVRPWVQFGGGAVEEIAPIPAA
jgi:hypothetical protein